jgi:hypothetical protein
MMLLAVAGFALAVPGVAFAAFPGSDPTESPRANTPNDPGFDRCENDDPDTPPGDCDSYFQEQFGSFGFSPDSAQQAPGVKTQYADCSQLDQQGRDANVKAGDPACSQISGVRADTAWKYSAGSPGGSRPADRTSRSRCSTPGSSGTTWGPCRTFDSRST